MTDPAADLQLEAWWRECVARSGRLPAAATPVQGRLVREVGRAELAGVGAVYLKVMGFPRAKDRLRYLLRARPARREADLLAAARAAGIPCPDVLAARTCRRLGLPRVSLLVTRALATAAGAPAAAQIAQLSAALAAAGIFHPDLHPGNFVLLADGGCAVLDLQSARQQRGPLGRGARIAMGAKLLAGAAAGAGLGEELLAAGLLPDPAALGVARQQAARLQVREQQRRIERCWQVSTEFVRERRFGAICHRRRPVDLSGEGTWVCGGRELRRYWVGDRVREVLGHEPPLLGALIRNSWWFPRAHSVYIPRPCGHELLQELAPDLEKGYASYRALVRALRAGMAAGAPRSST